VTAFERAIRSARDQNAKLLELQAVSRLAEHQLKAGEDCAAFDRLVMLCDWFGPASQVPDVVRARELVASEAIAQ
jgi:hypothetical protein